MAAPRAWNRRRTLTALVLAAMALAAGWAAAGPAPAGDYELVRQLMSENRKERRRAVAELARGRDENLLPGLVDALFFTPRGNRGELLEALSRLSGERLESYHQWVEYIGRRQDIIPRPGYFEWKVSLLERIDSRYRSILYPGAPVRIRLEEVVWGGVPIAGIPALVDPGTVPAAEADYLRPDEKVFGVELGGEARAYPLRILDWHEMLDDVVGGRPVALSYCTLCGSGILYSRASPGGRPYTFGTSGLLYRSNKLMFDSETLTLWSNLTGEAVVGRQARSGVTLEVLPMTLTTWGEWRRQHPATRVLDLAWVKEKMTGYGFDYRPGRADRARAGVSFPVWQASDALPRDAEVYALRLQGAAKAYPLDLLLAAGVVNDRLGGQPLVLVAEPASGAVRAFRRGESVLRAAGDGLLVEEGGARRWRVTEEALVAVEEGSGGGEGGAETARLERLPGHVAFWFGWYGFYPRTEVYRGDG